MLLFGVTEHRARYCKQCREHIGGKKTRVFCSRVCKDKYHSHHRYLRLKAKPTKVAACGWCGSKIETKGWRKYCAEPCQIKAMGAKRRKRERQRMKQLQANTPCIVCGCKIKLDTSRKLWILKTICSHACHVRAYRMREKGIML